MKKIFHPWPISGYSCLHSDKWQEHKTRPKNGQCLFSHFRGKNNNQKTFIPQRNWLQQKWATSAYYSTFPLSFQPSHFSKRHKNRGVNDPKLSQTARLILLPHQNNATKNISGRKRDLSENRGIENRKRIHSGVRSLSDIVSSLVRKFASVL